LGIKVFDFDEVVEEVVSDDVVVREDGGDDDSGGIFTSSFSGARFEATVGFGGTEPEAEGLFFWRLRKEVRKVARVVGITHLFERWLEPLSLEGWSGRVFSTPSGFEATGAPTFTSVAERVTGFLKEIRVGGKFGGKSAVNVTGFFEPPDRLASEDGRAGGTACGGIAECMGETKALICDTIKCRSFDDGVAIGSGVGVALIVRDTEKNIGPAVGKKAGT
jgi:hypothetical protein